MTKKLVIIGASGHGKVIADIALKNGYEIIGFLDDNENVKKILGFNVIGKVAEIHKWVDDCEFVIAIGNNVIRERIAETYNVKWATLIHPTVNIGLDVKIGEGTVIMAKAVLNSSVTVGKHCIVNTGAIVEHDNVLEDYVHISPNTTLAGTVCVGKKTHIGVGAVVRNNLSIVGDVIVGAGAVVVKDISEAGVYIGVPARRMK